MLSEVGASILSAILQRTDEDIGTGRVKCGFPGFVDVVEEENVRLGVGELNTTDSLKVIRFPTVILEGGSLTVGRRMESCGSVGSWAEDNKFGRWDIWVTGCAVNMADHAERARARRGEGLLRGVRGV